MKIIIRLLTIFLIVILLTIVVIEHGSQQPLNIVEAFGPLTVTFPSTPLFHEVNWKPGNFVTKTVLVENTDAFSHKIGIRAVNFSDSGSPSLSGGLSIVISQNGVSLYGQGSATGAKTLLDFYNEPVIWLGNLKGNGKVSFDIKVKMDETDGNEFQGSSTTFDLLAGIDDTFILPTLKPLPTLRPFGRAIPTFRPLPTLRDLPTLPPIRGF